jgi:hypothetical protein
MAAVLLASTCVQNVLSRSMFQGPSSRVGRSDPWRTDEEDYVRGLKFLFAITRFDYKETEDLLLCLTSEISR